jgi:hypothetical protein
MVLRFPKYLKPKLIADLKTRLPYIQERYDGVVHVDVIWKLQKMTGIAFIYRMKDFDTSIYHWDDVPNNFLFHGPSGLFSYFAWQHEQAVTN